MQIGSIYQCALWICIPWWAWWLTRKFKKTGEDEILLKLPCCILRGTLGIWVWVTEEYYNLRRFWICLSICLEGKYVDKYFWLLAVFQLGTFFSGFQLFFWKFLIEHLIFKRKLCEKMEGKKGGKKYLWSKKQQEHICIMYFWGWGWFRSQWGHCKDSWEVRKELWGGVLGNESRLIHPQTMWQRVWKHQDQGEFEFEILMSRVFPSSSYSCSSCSSVVFQDIMSGVEFVSGWVEVDMSIGLTQPWWLMESSFCSSLFWKCGYWQFLLANLWPFCES